MSGSPFAMTSEHIDSLQYSSLHDSRSYSANGAYIFTGTSFTHLAMLFNNSSTKKIYINKIMITCSGIIVNSFYLGATYVSGGSLLPVVQLDVTSSNTTISKFYNNTLTDLAVSGGTVFNTGYRIGNTEHKIIYNGAIILGNADALLITSASAIGAVVYTTIDFWEDD